MKYNIKTPNGKTTVIANSRIVAKSLARKAMNIEHFKDIPNCNVFVSLAKD